MIKKSIIRYIEVAAFLLITVIAAYGFYIAGKGQEAFMHWLREDGFVENMTVLFLLVSCGIAIYRSVGFYKSKQPKAVFMWGVLAFLFFFAAGEEISWGQRIFNIETPEFFMKRNLQEETNLHNLVVGDVKINILIFSQMLFGVMAFYLILLRPLVSRVKFFRNLVAGFKVPLARWSYVAMIVVFSFAFSTINLLKEAELIEFVFSVIFLLIFLNPIFVPRQKEIGKS
jgi:hypothetical protein